LVTDLAVERFGAVVADQDGDPDGLDAAFPGMVLDGGDEATADPVPRWCSATSIEARTA